MMRQERNRCALMLLLAGLAVLACRTPDYFPLRENQEWRYVATEYRIVTPDTVETETSTYVIAATGSAVEPGIGRVFEVRITRDERRYLTFFFRRTRDAVSVLPASHLDGLEPTAGWVKLLELPLRKGTFWYGDDEHSVSFEVANREMIDAPTGSYRNCFHVRIHAPEPYLMDLWLAPDLGIVRWLRRFSTTRFEVSDLVRR